MTEGFEIVRYDHKAMGQTDPDIRFLNQEIADKATAFHSSFPQYQPTPLRRQKCLAQQLGVGEIYVKDESYRFGLNAFKVLGGSFAIGRYIAQRLGRDISELPFQVMTSQEIQKQLGQLTFVTATDGNHGRGVAWTANQLGQRSVVYENSACKQQIFFIPDEIYQQPGASMESMAKLYACLYTQWSQQRYEQLVQRFPIDPKRKLSTCSKGMRRQIAIILGMSCMPKYLLLDEAFDGLDPVIRVAVRKLISDDVIERGTTVLIASHNLRELEDLCDQVGLLHGGHILFQRELDQLRCDFAKIQFAARPLPSREQLAQLFPIISMHSSGSIAEMVVRGNPIQIQQKLSVFHPLLCETVPLTLEEIFITEMEAVGYDYNNVIF